MIGLDWGTISIVLLLNRGKIHVGYYSFRHKKVEGILLLIVEFPSHIVLTYLMLSR